jgi:hypothetical protein
LVKKAVVNLDKKSSEAIKSIFEKYRLYKYLEYKSFGYKMYCETVEKAVNSLPFQEKLLITERYLVNDSEYLTDEVIYKNRFIPVISAMTYSKIRKRAFSNFVRILQIQ